MLVDDKVVVEIKSTHDLHPSAERQLLNYVRASTISVGMLLHFAPKPRFYRKVQSVKHPNLPISGYSRVLAETRSTRSDPR